MVVRSFFLVILLSIVKDVFGGIPNPYLIENRINAYRLKGSYYWNLLIEEDPKREELRKILVDIAVTSIEIANDINSTHCYPLYRQQLEKLYQSYGSLHDEFNYDQEPAPRYFDNLWIAWADRQLANDTDRDYDSNFSEHTIDDDDRSVISDSDTDQEIEQEN